MVTLTLDPKSDIAKALESVDTESVVLVSNGERFRVSRVESSPTDDDEEFEAALRAVFGILSPEEAERRIRDIYRWREEGTRSIVSGSLSAEDEIADDELWADYDPEAVREALRAAAGIFPPEEGERLKRDIYRWREEGSKPPIKRAISDRHRLADRCVQRTP